MVQPFKATLISLLILIIFSSCKTEKEESADDVIQPNGLSYYLSTDGSYCESYFTSDKVAFFTDINEFYVGEYWLSKDDQLLKVKLPGRDTMVAQYIIKDFGFEIAYKESGVTFKHVPITD